MTKKHRGRRGRPNFGTRWNPFEHNAAHRGQRIGRHGALRRGYSREFVIFDEVDYAMLDRLASELALPYRLTPTHGGFDD